MKLQCAAGPEHVGSLLHVKASLLLAGLVAVSAVLLVVVFLGATRFPAMVSPSMLAYTCGLRHALDADHIAAIDNVTRKLMQDGRRPLTIGFWFSLGHSSVVVLMCVIVASGSSYMRKHLEGAQAVGAIVGTCVSASMLLLIGGFNAYLACKLWSRWQRTQVFAQATEQPCYQSINGEDHRLKCSYGQGHGHDENGWGEHSHLITVTTDAKIQLGSDDDQDGIGGFIVRYCPFLFNGIDAEWKMFPLGFLFGLGFDTASEVVLLGLAATQPKADIPASFILFLPLLFAAGMSLVDTFDGMMMVWAYGWALVQPAQKLFFNFYLTAVSAAIALAIGVIEVLSLWEQRTDQTGAFWQGIRRISENSELIGFSILGFFAFSLVVAAISFKYHFPSSIDQRGDAPPTSTASPATSLRAADSQQAD